MKKPALVGLALLLLVPIVVLLVIGINSLRQDRIQAHQEATERAQQLADHLATSGFAMFTHVERQTDFVFTVDGSGKLLFPPPLTPLAPTPLSAAELTPEQASLFRRAQAEEDQTGKSAQALADYVQFCALNPPARFMANALYSRGLLHMAQGEFAEATRALKELTEKYPGVCSEGGSSLDQLASLKLLELQMQMPPIGRVAALDTVCSNLIHRPTPLTRPLLRRAGEVARVIGADSMFSRWIEVWDKHERTRRLYAKAAPSATNGAFWFSEQLEDSKQQRLPPERNSQDWLAVMLDKTSNEVEFACFPESQVRTFVSAVADEAQPIADYLTAEITVGQKTMAIVNRQTPDIASDQTKGGAELLGLASRPKSGNAWLQAKVHLAHPESLYRRQQSRRRWFGALIATCGVTALVGLAATGWAFRRQERLSELKSNFVASVSHELRTPVAAVRLMIEGLETGRVAGAAKQKEYLHLMGQECRRLSGLIENILDFSRIDDGRKQYEFSPTDIELLLADTLKIIQPYAAERNISLCSQAAGASPLKPVTPVCDGPALRQAVLNLLDNAIKHSRPGEAVTVGLEWPSTDNEPTSVRLWVEDHGPGIPREEQERIFERFYRRGSELNRETRGVGIGLTIVKGIVEAHRGRVLVQSVVGEGSRFIIELPLNSKRT